MSNSSLTVDVRTSADGGSTWSDWTTRGSGDIIVPQGTSLTNYRVQWRATLSTSDPSITPSLDDVAVTVYGGYSSPGTYTSPVLDVSSVGLANDSTINWNQTIPIVDGQVVGSVQMETRLSTDGGSTYGSWQAATNGGAIPGITLGTDLSNGRLQYRVTMSTTNTSATPAVNSINLNIQGQVQESTPVLLDGKISGITVDSAYFTGFGPLSTPSRQRTYLPAVVPSVMGLSGDGNFIYYKNPQDGKLYCLNLLTGSNSLSSTNLPVKIKVNYDGTKVAFTDSSDKVYLYNSTTSSTTEISSSR